MNATPGRTEFSRRTALRGAGLGALGALLTGLPVSFARANGAVASAWPQVAQLLAAYVQQRKVANMVAAIGQGEAAPLIFGHGADSLGGERLADAHSIYRIYSMTKPITGMAAMLLIEEGRLSLDQPLHSILPRFREMQVQKLYDGPITPDNLEPAVRPITIRHLLTHTAGLGYSIIQQGPLREALIAAEVVPGVVTRLDLPQFMRGKPADSLEIFADRAADLPLVYQPGTRWSYSISLDVLGRVIEVVSGQPFDAFLQERIFEPCGMRSTWFQVPASEQHRLTSNYGVVDGLLLPVDPAGNSIYLDPPPFPFGGAGLASTPHDYDRFLKMLAGHGMIDGRRVLGELAVRVGTSDLFPDTMDPDDGMQRQYGYGAGGRVGRGAQAGTFGWAGAAGTIGFVDMRRGLRAGLFTQYVPSQTYPLLEEFPAAILADLAAQEGRA